MNYSRLPVTLLALLLWSSLTGAADPARYALVIGNADYVNEAPLVNTLNDARDIAARLTEQGFTVTKVENADRRQLGRAINRFLRRIRGSDATALVYYSGHGLQVDGLNYLLPVDARIEDELDVPLAGLPVNRLLAGMGGRGDDAVNLVILDACRDNPFKKAGNKSIGDKGLARVDAPGGTLILYATKPGDVASDNPGGRNGLFTKHLLRAMDKPGLKVQEAFQQVAANVYTDSNRRQTPWQEGVIFRPFYFLPPVAPVPGPAPIPPPPPLLGYLQVSVDVARAEVRVNGRPAGIAAQGKPLNLTRVPAGSVTVTVQAGDRRVERRETVRPRRWTQAWFQLAPAAPPVTPPIDPTPADAAPTAGRTFRDRLRGGGLGPEMVTVPAGSFMMGSTNGDHDEKPVHRVRISRAFAIGKYEVTFDEYDRFCDATGRKRPDDEGWGRGRRPVIHVSWEDATAYTEWLSAQTGQRYRLPTEAEWEYAARAGTTTAYWWGDAIGRNRANCDGCGSRWDNSKTAPVGSFPANPFGLYDTAGNVWEWVADWYATYPDAAVTDPVVRQGGSYRVNRGGSWDFYPRYLRAAYRYVISPGGSGSVLGFRVARTF